jgi:Tfp pilus assembly protein PilV
MRAAVSKSPSVRQRVAGFTIVEVMMAATILVVGFTGVIQTVTIGSEMMATARRQTLANQILTHHLAADRYRDWSAITTLPAGPVVIATHFASAIQTSGTTFTLTRQISTPDTDLREVTYTLTWTVIPSGGLAGRTYTRMASSYFGKYGLHHTYRRA